MQKLCIGSELPPGPVVLWTGYKYLPYQIYGETLLYSINWDKAPNAFFDFPIVYQWYMDRFWGVNMTCLYYRIGDKWGGIPGGVFWGYNNKGKVMRFPSQTHYEKRLDVTLLYKIGVGDDLDDIVIDYDQEYCFRQVTLWE